MMLRAVLITLFSFNSVVVTAQSGLEFGTSSTLLRSNVFDLATVAQIVGTPHPDLILRNDFDLLVYDGDLPESAPPVALIPGSDYPREVIVIDVDADGDMDIVDSCPGFLVRIHSQVGGTFVTDIHYLPEEGEKLRFGDYDDDGSLDIATGRTILLRQPAGGYVIQSSTLVPPGATRINLLAEDFDGDGDIDIAAYHLAVGQTSLTSQIFRRLANGTLEPRQQQVLVNGAETFIDAATDDFDGDGRMDVLVVSLDRNEHLIRFRRLEAPLANTFATIQNLRSSLRTSLTPSTLFVGGLVVKDIDSDGDRDVVMIAQENLGSSPFAIMLEGTPSGTLSFHAGFGLSLRSTVSEHFVDWNGDGTIEMVWVDTTADALRSVSAGSLNFVPEINPPTNSLTGSLVPNGQTYFIGTTVVAQTLWTATTPSGSRALRGKFFQRTLSSIGSQGSFQHPFDVAEAITIGSGGMASEVYGGAAAGVTSVAVAGSTLFTLRFGGQVTVDGGSPQSTNACDLMNVGLRARVTDVAGQVITNQSIGVSTTPPGVVQWTADSLMVNSQGYATFTGMLQSSIPSTFDVTFNAGGVGFTTVTLTVTGNSPGFLQSVLGDGQFTSFGQPFDQPFVVRVVDALNQPLVGSPVHFTVSRAATATSPTVVPTDANGFALVTATGTSSGPATITASIGGSACVGVHSVALSAFVRRLSATLTTANLAIVYRHEHSAVPLLFAVDAPQPPIVQSYGTLYTSVLNPGPNFGFLDGLGILEPADPTVVTGTTGTWVRIFGVTPALAGISIVMQVYGVDTAYPFPTSILISNPASVTF